MAVSEPTEDAISQVIEVTDLDPLQDRDMVMQALKSNNGDAQTVILSWYEDPSGFRQKYVNKWDEAPFTADRDGSNHNTGISFHIEAPDQHESLTGIAPPENHGLTAPSRPPSRTNNRSPLDGIADWTVQTAGVPNSQAQEDEDMQRALRESAQEAGISMPQQESGVISASTSTPYFGPANRTDYDQGSWAMVPAGKTEVTVRELSPPASGRKRVSGAPAFLVRGDTSTGDHRLGGLLTILHEIPLARNALLRAGESVASYGHNSEWWKGQEILAPHVLARLQAGEIAWGDTEQTGPVFEEEIHRLMAFLDSTERSYGTSSVLFGLIPYPGLGTEKQFYELLGERNATQLEPLFTKVVLTTASEEEDGETEEVAFGVLETEHVKSEFQNIKTLYESLDHVIWGDVLSWGELREGAKIAMFRDMGEVVAINMSGDGPDAGSFEIPEVFYPERWLESRKGEALQMMKSWEQTKRAITALEAAELKLYEIRDPESGTVHDRRVLAQKALEQWEGYREYLEGRAKYRVMSESGFDTNKYPDYRFAPTQLTDREQKHYQRISEVVDYTKNLLSDVSQRVKGLHVELEKIRAKQRILGRLLTDPDKPGRETPMTCKKYLLRGIATSTDVIYVCQRKPEELIELDTEPEPRDQWWRLAFSPQDRQEPVKTEALSFEQVRVRMWEDSTTPLLVYATETALDTPNTPLSEALERFVKAENKAFSQELSREEWEAREESNVSSMDILTSPSKRKHRSDSMDSMLSNRASVGSQDLDVFDQPFDDLDIINGVEMTPVSETTSHAFAGEEINLPKPKTSTGPVPPLPDRPPVPPKPNFLSGSTSSQVGVAPVQVPESPLVPEMQERSRPPSFLAPSNSDGSDGDNVKDSSGAVPTSTTSTEHQK